MLRLINVCKKYNDKKREETVLNDINIDFKKREMVFILGASGSGKSTLLNIIGGILRVTTGKIELDGISIDKLNDIELDSYRNSIIGYIFQDYHLIDYMSVSDNIKIGQTMCQNNNRIDVILKQLGIYEKRNMLVNNLSGGEKQRVAIARAIINDPKIILADEPTGAMDSENGMKIMNILKDMSKSRLVIVVSHDNYLANKYADRIINIKDGKIDYVPQTEYEVETYKIKKKKIKTWAIIKLALKNLFIKPGRTILTSMATSLGFICLVLVLSLSRSFNSQIKSLEHEAVSLFPISIRNGDIEREPLVEDDSNDKILVKKKTDFFYTNKISQKYIDYLDNIKDINYITYDYDISMPFISDKYKMLDDNYMKMMPSNDYINENYEIVSGRNVNNENEILLKIDSHNRVAEDLLNSFMINNDIEYKDILNRHVRVILNDDYYIKNGDYYFINMMNDVMYKNSEIELLIVGIVREKENVDDNSYFLYNKELLQTVFNNNKNSFIVREQIKRDDNLLNINLTKNEMLSYLGYKTLPVGINIYTSDIEKKDGIIVKLDEYNKINDKIVYTDTMKDALNILKNFINILTIVLVVFSFISVIVSSLMICILTNTRVIERTREIGILRGLGARKKDITKLFNIENIAIGIISSLMGIIVIKLLINPLNIMFSKLLEIDNLLKIYGNYTMITIGVNIMIIMASGYIPAKKASKRQIIDCIYNK